MRKLLRGMRLPNHQWPEVMDHAVMLHNLLSSSSLPDNASPHRLWTGKLGNTKMLRVFGCMVQYRPHTARAGRFSQRAQWGLHLGIEKHYNAWKFFYVHSKETVAARDVIFYERLTLQTYLDNLAAHRDLSGGFRGNQAFASAADKADWDEQNMDGASEEAEPLPYCSVDIPMDDDNPRESVNAKTYFDFADTGYVTPQPVDTNVSERIGPNFLPDPKAGDEAAYPEDANLPRYTQSGLQILGLVTAVHGAAPPKEPANIQQALGGEHKEKLREAMDRELKALQERNTWKVVPIAVARNKTILTGKWVFRVKTKANGTIDKFKARWVVRGFNQEQGLDFTETFAPVCRHTSLRILLAIAAMNRKKLRQIDVANAFLYAPVDAEIFVELPHGSNADLNQSADATTRSAPGGGLGEETHGGGGGSGGGWGGGGRGGGGGGVGSSTGGGGGSGSAGRDSTQRSGSGGGPREEQQRSRETPSSQQLRNWYAGRQRGGGAGPCTYVLRTGDRAGEQCGGLHSTQRCFGRLTDSWRHQFPGATEIPRWGDLDEGDCYLCLPPDPGGGAATLGACEAAALGASASAAPSAGESALSGTASAQVFHTFTLDSGASRSFFRDRTTLTPLSRPVAVSLADPSGGPVLASFSTVLPWPAAPSGLPLGHVAASSQVLATTSGPGPESAPCSCRLLSHQTLLWHHRLGHPSLPRLRGMASRVLVSGLPRSLPPLPSGPTPTCVPCVEGRQRAAPHSSATSGLGLVLGGRRPVVLKGHADACWADDQATQRPSQGYTFSLGSGSVSWRSTRSSSVLGSSCEAEIYAGAMAAQELRWLTYLLTDLGEQPRSPPVLYANTADIFTKALPPGDHQRFCTMLACFALLDCRSPYFSLPAALASPIALRVAHTPPASPSLLVPSPSPSPSLRLPVFRASSARLPCFLCPYAVLPLPVFLASPARRPTFPCPSLSRPVPSPYSSPSLSLPVALASPPMPCPSPSLPLPVPTPSPTFPLTSPHTSIHFTTRAFAINSRIHPPYFPPPTALHPSESGLPFYHLPCSFIPRCLHGIPLFTFLHPPMLARHPTIYLPPGPDLPLPLPTYLSSSPDLPPHISPHLSPPS
ncbi:unnamed protein product [Closterium sp. NIES-53]